MARANRTVELQLPGLGFLQVAPPLLRIGSVIASIFVAHSAANQLCGWVQMFTNQLKNTLINNTNDITAMSVSYPVVVIIFILPPKFFSHVVAMFQYVTTK